jgi:hypothetical protein
MPFLSCVLVLNWTIHWLLTLFVYIVQMDCLKMNMTTSKLSELSMNVGDTR